MEECVHTEHTRLAGIIAFVVVTGNTIELIIFHQMDLVPGYDKVPKHASNACRQLADFVGRETEKIYKKMYKKAKKL